MRSRHFSLLGAAFAALLGTLPMEASAQGVQRTYAQNPGDPNSYSSNDLVESGHQFFGSASRGLALALQEAVRRWGEPNGYILGQEASGAFFGGLRYGEGKLFTRNAGEHRIFWQGPSLGFDVGGEGARTMMLVYNLPHRDALYRRFVGIDGSAYLIGGFGVTAAKADDMVVVPIRTGVGARLGVNMGYLKFTPDPTWNPF
ncbi:DUF1134 domain-containing protein [Microvirga terricola]|uniref:DUF1134 domain-containing protein n=1 Tax=Microvirga terricola TaxID=2719797 RepID=A0ABX0V9Z5_9HYPH|nr:DUF1134 domain-containing protein [Microvirga terricola]NIX76151.1 DUF1134 domain-containing protein [Microvirga terricola]